MSIFDAIEALKTQIEAQAATPNVSIGIPIGGVDRALQLEKQAVWIPLRGEESPQDREPALSDLSAFEVRYEIPVRFVVERTTNILTEVFPLAKAIHDAILAGVASDTTLGGAVQNAWVSAVETDEGGDDTSLGIGCTMKVRCVEYLGG